MGMYDPNESFNLLAIFDLDSRDSKNPTMNYKTYDEKIHRCGKWISNSDHRNKTNLNVVPTFSVLLMFDNIYDEPDIKQKIFTFVITQPESYFQDRSVEKLDIDFITNNISVLLSVEANDNEDSYAGELLQMFANNGYEYVVKESYLHYSIDEGNMVPMFIQKPFWEEVIYS